MRIWKCDLCKEEIPITLSDNQSVTVQLGHLKMFELCRVCGVPIAKFLIAKKLLKPPSDSTGKSAVR